MYIFIYNIYIYTHTTPDRSSASTFSLSPAHSTSALAPWDWYSSSRWTTFEATHRCTHAVYIYIYVYIHMYIYITMYM